MTQIISVMRLLILFITLTTGVSQNAISDVLTPPDRLSPPVVSNELLNILTAVEQRLKNKETDPGTLKSDLQRLADKEDPIAKFFLAVMFKPSDERAMKTLLYESASGGCAGAASLLGMLLMKENEEGGLAWLTLGANSGDSTGQMMLGIFFLRDLSNISRNKASAYAWLKLAIRQTYSSGQKAAISLQLLNLENTLTASERNDAFARYNELQQQIAVVPDHICGQSLPSRDQGSTPPEKRVSLFDLFPTITTVVQLETLLSQRQKDKPIVIIVDALWDTFSETLAKWIVNKSISPDAFECCFIVVADVTDNQSLLKYFKAFGAPYFIAYDVSKGNRLLGKKSGGFRDPAEFINWLKSVSGG